MSGVVCLAPSRDPRMTGIAESILGLPPGLALALVFALPLLEASAFVGFVVPGEIGVLLGGVLANQHKLSLTAVLALGISGAIIGDSIGYEVGRRYGETLLRKIPDRLLDEGKLQRTKETVRRLGGRAVFVGRFTTAARVLVPGLAGMARIPYGRLLAFNIAGGALWAATFVLLGYAVGSHHKIVERNATYVGIGLLVVLATVLLLRRQRSRHKQLSPPS